MKKLTLKTDRLAGLSTDELHQIVAGEETPLCPVTDIVRDLLTGMCIDPPSRAITCGCS